MKIALFGAGRIGQVHAASIARNADSDLVAANVAADRDNNAAVASVNNQFFIAFSYKS